MLNGNAVLVVLGDVGHSPRMCNHAHSLASRGIQVDLVGYRGSQPHPRIFNDPLIRITTIPEPPKLFSSSVIPNPLRLLLKFAWMAVILLFTLLIRTPIFIDLVMIQNPPGIPAMLVCWLVARLKLCAFVVDWHNYTYSMLHQTFVKQTTQSYSAKLYSLLISLAAAWEGFFGRRADRSATVSNMMRKDLKERWDVCAVTLYDKPPEWNFLVLSVEEKHDFLYRLFASNTFPGVNNPVEANGEATFFTKKINGRVQMLDERPFLLVSSTSWTEDEDFGILLDALVGYGKAAELELASTNECRQPKIFVVITGKGPQKDYYKRKIAQHPIHQVDIHTAWLEPDDYPRLLACADLGISLHTSSLDLPMKIVDMFGCGLPLLAKRFPAIDEQVHSGQTGRLFDTPNQLKQQLLDLAAGFPNNNSLNELHQIVSQTYRTDWDSQWQATLWPVLEPFFISAKKATERHERFRYREDDYRDAETTDSESGKLHPIIDNTDASTVSVEDSS